MWHRLLVFLGVGHGHDWTPPGLGPEVNHPFFLHESLPCCRHCGGGWRHAIHREPYDVGRTLEVLRLELVRLEAVPRPKSAYLAPVPIPEGMVGKFPTYIEREHGLSAVQKQGDTPSSGGGISAA